MKDLSNIMELLPDEAAAVFDALAVIYGRFDLLASDQPMLLNVCLEGWYNVDGGESFCDKKTLLANPNTYACVTHSDNTTTDNLTLEDLGDSFYGTAIVGLISVGGTSYLQVPLGFAKSESPQKCEKLQKRIDAVHSVDTILHGCTRLSR